MAMWARWRFVGVAVPCGCLQCALFASYEIVRWDIGADAWLFKMGKN